MQANIDDETGQCDNTISVSEEESLKEFINKQGQNSGQIRYKDETLMYTSNRLRDRSIIFFEFYR